jgi:hypothetical protein
MRLAEEAGRRPGTSRSGVRDRAAQLADDRVRSSTLGARRHPRSMEARPAHMVQALQRTAGNRAVTQLVSAQRASLDAQRCGPHGCAGGDREALDDTGAAKQGVIGQEEEFPAQGRRTAQRVASFVAGPVNRVNNLATCVLTGAAVGVTWPSLNGTQFWSVAAAQGALVRPTLTVAGVAAGGFDARVDMVPTNTGSFDETVLARGPWRHQTTQSAIAAYLPGLAAACTGAGNTRFRAYGNPSDNAMFTANRRHEDHHAKDHKAAFKATIKQWDTRLANAKRRNRTFHGATAAEAEAALWTAMGGTPDQIAEAFMNRCQAAVIAYHGSARGGPVGAPTRPGSRNNCDLSWAHYRNPS